MLAEELEDILLVKNVMQSSTESSLKGLLLTWRTCSWNVDWKH